jgi:hypothetical protein
MKQDVPIHQLLFSTVRIEAQLKDGISIGTAFIVLYESEGKQYLFLVTNKHVIQTSNIGRFFFTKADTTGPLIGQKFEITVQNFEKNWVVHPNNEIDIVVMPLVPLLKQIEEHGQKVYYRSIPLSLIPSKEQEASLTALEEIIFIGYPSGIYDTTNLLPIIRKGITATPISIDYEGKPLFLIDAAVFRGSSGSPVLIYNQGSYGTPQGIVIGSRILFLGTLSQVIIREEKGRIDFVEIPVRQIPIVKTEQVLNLGLVIKARTIIETIESFLQTRGEIKC